MSSVDPKLSDDIETAKETITVSREKSQSRTEHEPTKYFSAKILRWFLKNSSSVAKATPVLIAAFTLAFGIYQYNRNMNLQRHVNAENTVTQFIAQVAELSALSKSNTTNLAVHSDSNEFLESMFASRAQMLIDNEHTGRFAGDIIRFFASNHYGQIIGYARGSFDRNTNPYIDINGSVFIDAKLQNGALQNRIIRCVGFDQGYIDKVEISNSSLEHITLMSTELANLNFADSTIADVGFYDAKFYAGVSFQGATLVNADFGNSSIKFPIVFESANILMSDLSNITINIEPGIDGQSGDEKFAEELSKANSLHGTKLSNKVEEALIKLLSKDGYDQLFDITVNEKDYLNTLRHRPAQPKSERQNDQNAIWQRGNCPARVIRDRKISAVF